jgi:hypothetical protein
MTAAEPPPPSNEGKYKRLRKLASVCFVYVFQVYSIVRLQRRGQLLPIYLNDPVRCQPEKRSGCDLIQYETVQPVLGHHTLRFLRLFADRLFTFACVFDALALFSSSTF